MTLNLKNVNRLTREPNRIVLYTPNWWLNNQYGKGIKERGDEETRFLSKKCLNKFEMKFR